MDFMLSSQIVHLEMKIVNRYSLFYVGNKRIFISTRLIKLIEL